MGIIQKQGISNTIITYIGIVIGFVNVIFIQPTFLTTEELGLIRVLYSFSAVIAMFLPLGIGNITLRFFPQFKNTETKHYGFFGIVLFIVLIGFLLITLLLYSTKNFFISQYIKESPLFTEYFNFVFPLTLFIALISVFSVYCQSLFKSSFPALLNDVVIRLLSIVIVSVYFIRLISLNELVIAFVLIYGLQVIVLLFYMYKIDKPSLKIDFGFYKTQNIKEIIKYGLLLSLTSFASLGIKYLDTIMVGKYLPLAMAGIYTVAVFIPTVIEAPVGALERISNAKIADAWSRNNLNEIEKIYSQSTKYLTVLGGFLFLMVNINLDFLLTFLPPDYSSIATVVLILSISTLFNMATGLNGGVLFSSPKYIYGSYMLFLLLFLSVINNMIFIPRYGLIGAAIATALASFIFNLIKYFFILKEFKMQPFTIKLLYAAFLIAGCFYLDRLIPETSNALVNIFIHSSAIGIAYITGVYFLNIIPEFHKYLPFRNRGKNSDKRDKNQD